MRNLRDFQGITRGMLAVMALCLFGSASTLAQDCEPRDATQFSSVVIFATNSVDLKEHSDVLSGDVVVQDVPSGLTLVPGFSLEVGNHTNTSATTNLAADSLNVQNQALVQGNVCYFSLLDGNGTILGSTGQLSSLPVFTAQPDFFAPVGSGADGDVGAPKNQTIVLAPGDYGRLAILKDATVILSGGNYEFDSIDIDKSGRLLYRAASEVRVRGTVDTGNSAFIGPEDGSGTTAKDLVMFVIGEVAKTRVNPRTAASVVIGTKGTIYANVFAENGTIIFVNQVFATGAFIAPNVYVGNFSQVSLDSAFVNDNPPVANDDTATVENAGTLTMVDGAIAGDMVDSVLANDSDPDGQNLVVTPQNAVPTTNGVLNFIAPDGTFSYTHDGSETFEDSFTYEVCDTGNPSACSTATVNITVLPANVTITVTKSGEGSGVVESDPAGIACGDTCSGEFEFESTVRLSATADPGSVFVGWTGPDDCGDGVLTANADITCNAVFETEAVAKDVRVRVVGEGSGRVLSNPRGIDCPGDCQFGFADFSRIELFAFPNEGSTFDGWQGDADCGDGVISGPENVDCIAVFSLLPTFPDTNVSVLISGTGSGTVSSSPGGILCPQRRCDFTFVNVPRVTLIPTAAPDSEFVGWIGDSSCGEGIRAGSDVTCTAVFDLIDVPDLPVTLSVTVSGGGAVSSNPAGISCLDSCSAEYEAGTEVRLFARPDPGFSFMGWFGDPDCTDGFVTLDSDTSCTAVFTP